MSLYTRADELRSKIEDGLKGLIKDCNELLDEDTWGHDEYGGPFMDRIEELVTDIRVAKRKWRKD